MTPDDFLRKWQGFSGTEKAGAQSHFNDLCDLLEVPRPFSAGSADDYTFEKSVLRLGAQRGFADVFKRHCFAWEYKKPSTDQKNLVRAYKQLKEYADGLDNPPLLIVSDIRTIRVHTQFTGYPAEVIEFDIRDLNDPVVRRRLAKAWTDPESFRPDASREVVTTRAAAKLGTLAAKLARDGRDPQAVAHFLNRLVFCMFVEDIGLLPDYIFAEILDASVENQDEFVPLLGSLFRAMKDDGGRFGTARIPWFNGGLFDDDSVIALNALQIRELRDAAQLDWTFVEPAIFGTLFEKGLNPETRNEMAGLFDAVVAKDKAAKPGAQPLSPSKGKGKARGKPVKALAAAEIGRAVGVHYTDIAKIRKIVEPVVLRPLEREWEEIKAQIAAIDAKAEKNATAKKKAVEARRKLWHDFRQRLKSLRVLDPACGSGNFLYVALLELKSFDKRVREEADNLALPPADEAFSVETVLGIEVNPYAAELARVSIWIGEIQWQMRNAAGGITRRPILGRMDGIRNQDALVDEKGREREWPAAECIVGNPPFLGDKAMIRSLGEDYTKLIRSVYQSRVPGGADLVCYWFEKARAMIEAGKAKRAGLVSTNSIRGGANRKVLDRIVESQIIFDAWSDEPWEQDGAAVRVSLVCYSNKTGLNGIKVRLNGSEVAAINSDLTSSTVNTTSVSRLRENQDVAYLGIQKTGPFDVPGPTAREWLQKPMNPNGCRNSEVLKPYWNGIDLTRRPRDFWLIDFPPKLD